MSYRVKVEKYSTIFSWHKWRAEGGFAEYISFVHVFWVRVEVLVRRFIWNTLFIKILGECDRYASPALWQCRPQIIVLK